jgi:hypothetical protein
MVISGLLPRIRCVKFWLLLGAAGLAVLAGINGVYQYVEWWGTPTRPDGPNGVVFASPWSQGVPGLAYIVFWLALGAVFAWLAARAHRKP